MNVDSRATEYISVFKLVPSLSVESISVYRRPWR